MKWQPIETAPKDGTQLLLWCARHRGRVEIGSFRPDDGFADDEPLWLDNSYDDFSCGYVSRPLSPTHWMPMPSAPEESV